MKKSYSHLSFETFLNNIIINEYQILINELKLTLFNKTIIKLNLLNKKKINRITFIILTKINQYLKHSIKKSVSLDQVFQKSSIQIPVKQRYFHPIYENLFDPSLINIPFIEEVSNRSMSMPDQILNNLNFITQIENSDSDYDTLYSKSELSSLESRKSKKNKICCFAFLRQKKASY
jgi:hypothetical protein